MVPILSLCLATPSLHTLCPRSLPRRGLSSCHVTDSDCPAAPDLCSMHFGGVKQSRAQYWRSGSLYLGRTLVLLVAEGWEGREVEDLGLGVSGLGGSLSFLDTHSFRVSPLMTWRHIMYFSPISPPLGPVQAVSRPALDEHHLLLSMLDCSYMLNSV